MRFRRPNLNRLQWRLTFTYTLVTTSAILVVEIVLLVVAGYFVLGSNMLPQMLVPSLQEAARDLAPYLSGPSPDRQEVAYWLKEFVRTGQLRRDQSVSVDLDPMIVAFAAIVDREGRTVGVEPPTLCPLNSPFEECVGPSMGDIMRQALAGNPDTSRLVTRDADNIGIAAPILDENGHVVGAVVLQLSLPLSVPQFLSQAMRALFPSALVVLAFAAVVGTVFGFVTARGLTRRLEALSHAADKWSQGDFSAVVRDTSEDELGHLARRLNRMAEELQNLLATRAELAALEERNRLARELHDAVKQQVFATAMQVAAARHLLAQDLERAKIHLEEAERLARRTQQELAVLIRELRPAALEGKGLVAALREYVAEWSQQTGIEADLRVQGERGLPLHVEQALFRIVQEALSNVAKHSEATHVDIRLLWARDEVTLIVADNGRGFDVDAVRGKGLGLRSIEERVAGLRGQVRIESKPGQGARVVARIPVGNERLRVDG